MATTQEKRNARAWALNEIINLISEVRNGHAIAFPHKTNRYSSDRTKTLVDIEIDRITWQLQERLNKIEIKVVD